MPLTGISRYLVGLMNFSFWPGTQKSRCKGMRRHLLKPTCHLRNQPHGCVLGTLNISGIYIFFSFTAPSVMSYLSISAGYPMQAEAHTSPSSPKPVLITQTPAHDQVQDNFWGAKIPVGNHSQHRQPVQCAIQSNTFHSSIKGNQPQGPQ